MGFGRLPLVDRCWTPDAGYWIFWIAKKVRSKNIQHPETGIQYHAALSRLFDSAASKNGDFL
jgi:hypothetical protein